MGLSKRIEAIGLVKLTLATTAAGIVFAVATNYDNLVCDLKHVNDPQSSIEQCLQAVLPITTIGAASGPAIYLCSKVYGGYSEWKEGKTLGEMWNAFVNKYHQIAPSLIECSFAFALRYI